MDTYAMARGLAIAFASALAAGCYNPMVAIDQRSALEQQLTRVAIWRTVEQLAVHKDVLEGKWRIAVLAPNPRDQSWIEGALRIRLGKLGVVIASDDDADASVIVAGVVYAGIDVDNFAVGVPIPGGAGQALAFYQSITERGRAEIFLSFQDPTGMTIGTTEPLMRDAHYTSMFFLTLFGPVALTDLEISTGARFREMGLDTLHQADDVADQADDWLVPSTEKTRNEDAAR